EKEEKVKEGGEKKEEKEEEEEKVIELDDVDIERAKPIQKTTVMVEPGPDPVKDARFLFRNLLFGFKTIAATLQRLQSGGPDAEMMCRFFESAVKCMVLFDSTRDQGREQKEVMEVFSNTLVQTEIMIFQEVIEHRMEFFLRELIRNHELLVIPQTLLSNEIVSQNFVAIVFRFLSSRLEELGKNNKEYTSVMLRLYKMSFMAVTIFPEKNEPVLLPHLSNLIMTSLKLASQAAEPNSYYLLLRALFRSIGGGRFEILYKEVLPLLQVLLEQLNALLKAADKSKRDLFAELILTVPVRLSVLLPYLSYLMRPLVHALQAGPELISQGLRTLELCVDNLTQEFLNPLMAPVIDEVMAGLWKLLRPLPFNHQHAHTTMRILGKIGGRNRKGFGPPQLEWKPVGAEALLNIKFEGKDSTLRVAPIVDVATKIIKRGDVHYRRAAYSFLKYAVALFLKDGLPVGEPEETFGNILRGLFDATRVDEFTEEANQYLIDLAQHIFAFELGKDLPDNSGLSKQVLPFLPLSTALLDGIIENLCSVETPDLPKAAAQTQKIIEDLIAMKVGVEGEEKEKSKSDPKALLLHQLGSKLGSLCYDPSWQRKTGAALGLSILTSKVNLDVKWTVDHGIDIIRGLLFSLKDMPGEAPLNGDLVADTLLHVVRVCAQPKEQDETPAGKSQVNYVVGLLLLELCSQVASVRETVKKALQIFSDVTGTPLSELLHPVRDRLISPIFTKPLRALGFTMQIGHIDAITYCISLKPPLIEFEDDLSRLLREALGIADAEDSQLMGSKTSTTKTSAPLTQLRVVCVQLLSAALASPDFQLPKHSATRLKALSVFFKLLYASAPEVVEASYQSLKQVMIAQGKLPKDLLQSGLKPVLMNLADHKKLSVASLQGLARLLELLTNYFKVEIGHKLVDHFRNLAVPADIQRAAIKQPSQDSELEIMAAIINIFHLLPHPAAGVFLEDVVKMVVEVERQLKKLKTSIFTKPLAEYLKFYPVEATTYFFGRLSDERFVLTFRSILASEYAADIRAHIAANAADLFPAAFATEGDLGYHAALVIKELIAVEPDWIVKCPPVLNQLIERWVSAIRRRRLSGDGDAHFQQLREDAVVLDIFVAYLEQAEHVDLLFHIVDVYTYFNSSNHVALSRFLNKRVALTTDVAFKLRILDRFIEIFENTAVSKAHKTAALRILINPMLLIAFARPDEAELVDPDFLNKLHLKLWQPLLTQPVDGATFDDEALRIELCHMSTLVIRARSELVVENKKDVIKFGWVSMRFDDITVTQAAYLLIAVFLEQYDSPFKILIQIYTGLLKSHQPEARAMVREALDVLTAAFLSRPATVQESSPLQWAKWTRKILLDESASLAQMINVYQLLVRHADLFYPFRELFVPLIVASLAKLNSGASVTADSRTGTLDVIELILKWETKRIQGEDKAKVLEDTKMDLDLAVTPAVEEVEKSPRRGRQADRAVSIAPSATSNGPSSQWSVPPNLRDQIVNNLLRFIAQSPEAVSRNNIVSRALALLKELIAPGVWSETNVKLHFFSRQYAHNEVSEETLVALCNSAEVLVVVASYKPAEWVIANITPLHQIVEKGFAGLESRLHLALRPLLERIFDALPRNIAESDLSPEARADVDSFFTWAKTTIDESLRSMNSLSGTMMILQAWSKTTPEAIDHFIQPLIRVFSRYTKDHISAAAPVSSGDPQLRLLVSSLEVLRQRVSFLGDQRRWFLSAIVQLVEKSSNLDVCRFLLQMTRKWVIEKEEQFPTNKEKAGILLKMMSFESRNSETLQKDFLTLILDIYSDPTLARTDLTVKLEPAFLLGCRIRDPIIRSKFLDVFDKSLATGLFSRLHFVLGVQSWEPLGDTYWVHQALDLVLGAVDTKDALFTRSATPIAGEPTAFVQQLEAYTTGDLLGAARKLLYADPAATQAVWVSTFKSAWAALGRRDQLDVTRFIIGLLTKEFHLKSVDRRPNAIQTLLAGALACSPTLSLPPHLIRYLGKTFNAWHIGIELLQEGLENPKEEESIRDTTMDALAETYSELSEDDLLYGLWRRRAGYNETNAAISWEQIGQWGQAQVLYESAQITARSGVLPFSEAEMALWEDHWIITAQKLQQWDVLAEFVPSLQSLLSLTDIPLLYSLAKNEGNKELLLECAWRLSDWSLDRETVESSIDAMSPVATPRRRIFEAYLALLKAQSSKPPEDGSAKKLFNKLCDEGIQLSLRKWYYLPDIVSQAHVPLLQVFQQFVELQEAQQIFASLAGTNQGNLDSRSQELKSILGTWRDRLPNLWDDINVWSDLVAWRQHVFSAVNKAYLPLVTPAAASGGVNGGSSSFAYRGYHETAWIINRFAHVARKHHLNEVCITSLTKIYTLPNIEIQEAFLKLREQAKCHYQNAAELSSGLEVINNTNLMYFNAGQKAEFFTLKGMFLAKLHLHEEANQTFNLAVSMDMGFAKAWAEWGEYHDRMYKEQPHDLTIAANAVSCYLQAAGLYKSAKVRKLLVRILWLLSLDDAAGTVSKAFDNYKGEVPTWYWITFIPQLLMTLSSREARYARIILMKIAKTFPQSLFFQLRTMREDLTMQKRQHAQQTARAAAIRAAEAAAAAEVAGADGDTTMATNEAPGLPGGLAPGSHPNAANGGRYPWEHVDEIMSILKTAFPLLALSMEMIVDQVATRFKPGPDEDIYRLVSALLSDALQQYVIRAQHPTDDGLLAESTTSNVARFAENLHPAAVKSQFESDFLTSKPTLRDYVERLQAWRDRYESLLNKRAKKSNLEIVSHWLVEFQYQKFDEIEVPGQYLKHEDNNAHYVRISHFANKFDVTRSHGTYFRRLTILGHDGSVHRFAIQVPSVRTSRREERIMQLFRMLNCPLATRKESRKRNLFFHIPIVVPLAPGVRLVENDASVTSLQDIYELYCESKGMQKEEPILTHTEKLRFLHRQNPPLGRQEIWNGRQDIAEEIRTKMVPDDLLKNYMIKTMQSPSELWHIRKQMTLQMASFIFATYVMSMGARVPSRIHISRSSGKMYTSDMLPSIVPNKPEFVNTEAVPFRFTPNLQRFITPIGTEGLLTSSMLAIARCLTESEFDLEHRLSIFVREEVVIWTQIAKTDPRASIRELVLNNVDAVVRRAAVMSCKMEREKPPSATVPVNQSVLELLIQASSLQALGRMEPMWAAWL
ncbi:transformation/transcription domain-associated protein, partial [Phenoliferia sp. Uapishka_3]